MSFKPEVKTAGGGETWNSNNCRFETQKEALDYVDDLQFRWTAVTDTRVVEVDEPVTCKLHEGHRVEFLK
jgi:hypothetical protein